jgi:hypothetical protein
MPRPAGPPTRHSRRKPSHAAAPGKRRPSKKLAPRRDATKRSKRAQSPTRPELAQQVARELAKLRPVLRNIGTALLDRLDGELAGLERSLNGEDVSGERPVLPHTPVLSAMLADIQTLKLKPKKGRLKDLGRIEVLLESLNGRIPPDA